MADDYRGLFEAAIARLQPGNAMEKAAFETIESGKKAAIGASMQGLVSGGMAGSSLAGSVPLIAEKGAAASRLGVTAAREANLSNVQMQLGGLLFQGSEREKGQQFQAGESEKGRVFAAGENLLGRKFTAEENRISREFTSVQEALTRGFTGTENEKQRQFTNSQNALARELQAKQAELDRQFTSAESRKSEAYKAAQEKLTRDFTAAQAALDRVARLTEQSKGLAATVTEAAKAREFTAAQNALNRTATAEQNTAQLAAQYPSLTGGGNVFNDTAPSLFSKPSTGGGTPTGGWQSYPASKTSTAPITGQSWVNGNYIPTQAEEKTYYSTPTAAGPTSIQTAMKKLQETVSNAPGGTNNLLGWKFPGTHSGGLGLIPAV